MKIIKTAGYDGISPDPGLGFGITERDIDDDAGTGEEPVIHNQQGFLEINVDWDALMESHISNGYDVTPEMDAIDGVVPVALYYTFCNSQDSMFENNYKNIKITQVIITVGGGRIIVSDKSDSELDEDLLYRFKEDFEERIEKDINVDGTSVGLY